MTTDGPSTLTPEIKALVGREWVFTAPEEMGRASIRKFALATGEVNRLYYDEAYALKSRYGGTIAPPTLVCETWQYMDGELDELGSPSGRPTLHLGTEIRGGHEYTFHQPLRPEDILTARWKISDIREREGRTGTLIFLVMEITYANQRGETLAVHEDTTIFRVSGPEVTAGPSPSTAKTKGLCEPDIVFRTLESALTFEDIHEGDGITPLYKLITLPRMVFYQAATWDFHRYHYDHEYAAEAGFSSPFVDGQMLGAYLAQMLTNWAGDPGVISRLGFRFRDFAFPGDMVTCRGRVAGKSIQDGRRLVECELSVENQDGKLLLSPAHATLVLP